MDNALRDLHNSSCPTKAEFSIRSKREGFLILRSSYSLRVQLVHDGKSGQEGPSHKSSCQVPTAERNRRPWERVWTKLGCIRQRRKPYFIEASKYCI